MYFSESRRLFTSNLTVGFGAEQQAKAGQNTILGTLSKTLTYNYRITWPLGRLNFILRGTTVGYIYVIVLAVLVPAYETFLGALRPRYELRCRLWRV